MQALDWYVTLALWKAVVFMEGNYKRAIAGSTDDPYLKTFERRRDRDRRTARWRLASMASEDGSTTRRSVPRLLVDWGGVLTTDVFDSFRAFCELEGLEPDAIGQSFRRDPSCRELLIAFETGEARMRRSSSVGSPRFSASGRRA